MFKSSKKIITDDIVFSDFSLTNWFSDRGLTVNSVITDITSDRLITELGLSDYMGYSDSCSLTVSPYKDAVNGWKNGKYNWKLFRYRYKNSLSLYCN